MDSGVAMVILTVGRGGGGGGRGKDYKKGEMMQGPISSLSSLSCNTLSNEPNTTLINCSEHTFMHAIQSQMITGHHNNCHSCDCFAINLDVISITSGPSLIHSSPIQSISFQFKEHYTCRIQYYLFSEEHTCRS